MVRGCQTGIEIIWKLTLKVVKKFEPSHHVAGKIMRLIHQLNGDHKEINTATKHAIKKVKLNLVAVNLDENLLVYYLA